MGLLLLLLWGSACSTLIERRNMPREGSPPRAAAPVPAPAPVELTAPADADAEVSPDLFRRHDYFRFHPLQLPEVPSEPKNEPTDNLRAEQLPYLAISWNPVIRVSLFSRNAPQRLEVSAHAGILTFRPSDGNPFPLTTQDGRVQLEASGNEIRVQAGGRQFRTRQFELHNSAEGLARIAHPALGLRYYRGALRITAENNRLLLVNYVPLEDYVSSVVGSEMNFTNPEALKVQAVISRTYAIWNSRNPGRTYDLNDTVLNQVYLGELITSPRFRQAALATTGEVLSWSGELILAAYHSTCGGRTVANETVWSGGPLPWLRGAEDFGSCSPSPHFRWRFEVPKRELHELFSATALRVENGDGQQRASVVYVQRGSRTEEISANTFRLRFNQRYGTLALRSTHFRLEDDGETYIFEGRGLGHGIGLCQWGALGKAEAGWSYRDILRFYYNGVELSRLPGPQP